MNQSKRSKDGGQARRDGANSSDREQALNQPDLVRILLEYPNVWKTAPVAVDPEKWLDSWRIAKVVKVAANPEHYGFHFVGRNIRENNGAVSSKIEKFDPRTMSGVTHSGRVYRLVGPPGSNADAEYVFNYWLHGNRAEAEDATEEFIKQYGISLEHIRNLSE